MKSQVEIISASKCKSVNPLGYEPSHYFRIKKEKWQKAEAKRKTYKIVNLYNIHAYGISAFNPSEPTKIKQYNFKNVVEAEINDNHLTAVIL